MSDHSVDILTNGRWVPVNGILRWRGEHLTPPPGPPRPPRKTQRPRTGTCPCGAPAASEAARYCVDCRIESMRESWRESARRRKAARREVAA